MKKFLKDNATLIALVLISLLLTIASESFFNPRNLSNLFRQVTMIGVIGVGMTMVILLGGIDLSVGSIVGISAVTVTLLMQAGLGVWLSIILTILLTGVLIGMWNGFWIAKYKIAPFIITLGMMTIARGGALALSKGSSVPVTNSFFSKISGSYIPVNISILIIAIGIALSIMFVFKDMQEKKKYGIKISPFELIWKISIQIIGLAFVMWVFGNYKGIPTPVGIFIVIVGVGMFVLRNTKFGRNLYAVGGNEEAARLSGINVFKINMWVFTIISSLAAVSGILLASRLNSATPNLGNMFELDAITGVAIGGTSLTGGSGTISGTVIGVLIIGVLNNGMSLLGIETSYQFIVKGLIIIIAVWFDVISKKKKI